MKKLEGRALSRPRIMGRHRGHPSNLPGDDFSVLQEFAGKVVWRVSGEPDDRGGTFGDGTIRVFAAHLGPNPAWTNAVHGEFRQGARELNGDAVQRGFRNAVSGRPTIGAAVELPAAAGDVHDSRF